MIFFQLFYTFLLIGAFTFGGGYSMIAFIQNEVVTRHGWISASEFTDLLAVSQMTPGPVGINTATYAGYTAVLNTYGSADPTMANTFGIWAAVAGSLIASLAVIIVPVALVMLISQWFLRHKDNPRVATVMRILRLAVVGLVAAAALSLLTAESFGNVGLNVRFLTSVAIFLSVFLLSWRRKANPVLLILASGLVGLLVYSL